MNIQSSDQRVPDTPRAETDKSISTQPELERLSPPLPKNPDTFLQSLLSDSPSDTPGSSFTRAEVLEMVAEFEAFLGRYLPYVAAKESNAQNLSVASMHSILPLRAILDQADQGLVYSYDANHYVWSVVVETLLCEQTRELSRFDEDTNLNDVCVRDACYHRAIKSGDAFLLLQRAPAYMDPAMNGRQVSFQEFQADSSFRTGTREMFCERVSSSTPLEGALLVSLHDCFAMEQREKLEVLLRENAFLLRPRDRRFSQE